MIESAAMDHFAMITVALTAVCVRDFLMAVQLEISFPLETRLERKEKNQQEV